MVPTLNHTSYEWRRRNMVERLQKAGIHHPDVLHAVKQTPRHLFVEEALRTRAYDDMPLPIGLDQTISQPYTVAIMTQLLLGNTPASQLGSVLEIGTGCGYQTAILQNSGINEIYSIERLRPLHELAKHNLRAAGLIGKTRMVCGDGYLGLPEAAPFTGIIVTAAPPEVPLALLQQLAIGGRMVLPLAENKHQYLWLIEKTEQGFHESCIQEAHFVPLIADA